MMLNDKNQSMCWKCLAKYGIQSQLVKLMEECSELQKATCKMIISEHTSNASDNFLEELVDTIVMCQQMVLLYRLPGRTINEMAAAKLERALEAGDEH